jgi:hypothetical protein
LPKTIDHDEQFIADTRLCLPALAFEQQFLPGTDKKKQHLADRPG